MYRYTLSIIWLILISFLVVGCTNGLMLNVTDSPPGYIAYATLDESKPELVVITPDGKEVRRINLSPYIDRMFPTSAGNRVLYQTNTGKWFLVDTAEGKSHELLFPEARGVLPDYQFKGGQQWMVFGSLWDAYLVSLKDGETTYLNTVSKDIGKFVDAGGAFSPDEKYLALTSETGLWLVPTTHPGQARQLTENKITARLETFSNDGTQIIYSRVTPDAQTEIVIEAVDGSKTEVVATLDTSAIPRWVYGKQQLLFLEQGQLSLFDLTDRTSKVLINEGFPHEYCFVLDGRKVVVYYEFDGTSHWTLIDLDTGLAQTPAELQGYSQIICQTPQQQWLIFHDWSPDTGAVALELETGKVQPLLTPETNTKESFGTYIPSPDGHLSFLMTQPTSTESVQLWLLNAANGEARQLFIESNFAATGGFSPDSQWALVRSLGDKGENSISLMETDGEEIRPLGKGWGAAVWVLP